MSDENYVAKNKADIDSLIEANNEIFIYFIIDGLGGFIWRLNHDMANNRIEEKNWDSLDKDILLMAEVQQYAVSKLTKFGVTNPYLDEKKHPSPEYWAWFRWWNSYIKELPEEEWKVLDKKMSAKEDVSSYRPKGSWKDSLVADKKT